MSIPSTDEKLAHAGVAERLRTAYRALNAAAFLRRLTHRHRTGELRDEC
jgi:hypothetical protein